MGKRRCAAERFLSICLTVSSYGSRKVNEVSYEYISKRNSNLQIYTETLHNISVVAKSAANNIRQFIDKHDCEQLAPLFDLCSVLEELLPYLHKRTGEYCTRATRIEYVHKTYHVDLNVEFDRYCLDYMTEEDNADASNVERKADPFFFEITEIMASLKFLATG